MKKTKAFLPALALLAALALAFAGLFGHVYARASAEAVPQFYSGDMPLEQLILTKYWQAVCAWDGACDPSALFFDDTNAAYYAAVYEGEGLGRDNFEASGGGSDASEYGALAVYSERARSVIDIFNTRFRALSDELAASWGDLYFTVVNDETQEVWAPRVDLRAIEESGSQDAWKSLLLLRWNSAGSVVYQETWGGGARSLGTAGMSFAGCLEDLSPDMTRLYDVRSPHSVMLLIGIPRDYAQDGELYALERMAVATYCAPAFSEFCLLLLLLTAGAALWTGRRRGAQPGRDVLARIPPDLALFALFLLYLLEEGTLFHAALTLFEMGRGSAALTAAGAFALLVLCFFLLLSVRYAAGVYGLRACLWERCLLMRGARRAAAFVRRLWRAAAGRLRALWRTLTRVDLRGPADRTLARLLAVNFLIVTVICCFWFLGVLGTILYTALLFFLLRRRLREEQAHYAALLDAAHRMAEGDIATPVAGEMGLFNPVRDELNLVRAGFEKAVAAEVRSRNMKTELITNVSHDLKTPLTAIITYIGLLRDPALSDAERAKYIDTLDRKSQRLKQLIEDLFEISKAASGNAVMHYSQVDLAALLKQVQCELADRIEASGIEFRWSVPDGRLPLVLDGQKTYRIFENLVVNIVKYGLPGTRAYITLTAGAGGARVEFKNVSAAELDFDTQQITERFVRGDRSRSTEGSGLGLAIVKSFAELQGGAFEIVTDGDLFKALVTLPDTNVPNDGA